MSLSINVESLTGWSQWLGANATDEERRTEVYKRAHGMAEVENRCPGMLNVCRLYVERCRRIAGEFRDDELLALQGYP